jgi:membrane associated rhomboid family serine protease
MLIIPVGPENREIRRFPWVSVSLAVLMIAAFVLFGPPSWGGGWDLRVESRARTVESFLLEHPYLQPSPDIEPLLGDGARAEIRRRHDEDPTGKTRGLPSFVLVGQQAELTAAEGALRRELQEAPSWRYGFIADHPSFWDAVTSLFLHGGWLHLIGNLVFFLAMAPFLEDVYGRLLFLALYLSSGVVAAFAHAALTAHPNLPAIGASGAIAGVMGAFLVRLGTSRIRFLFFPILILPFIRISFFLRAAIFLPLWFATQALLATEPGAESGIALWAHIGGFLYGLVVAVVLRVAHVEEKWIDPAIQKQISWSRHPALDRAAAARLSGDVDLAEREIASALRDNADDPDALRMVFQIALDGGQQERSVQIADRLLALCIRRGEIGLARDIVFQTLDLARGALTPHFGLSAARFLENEREDSEALAVYEALVTLFPSDTASLQALVRISDVCRRRGDERGVRHAFERAASHPFFSPAWEAGLRGARSRPESPRR